MATLLFILAGLAGLGMLVCFILVLIKLFQENGPLHGILGLICSLYTFIWGWMNASRLNIRNIMLAWSACIVIYIIFYFAATAMSQ